MTDRSRELKQVKKRLGTRIRLLRRQNNLSQIALARSSEVSLDSVQKTEYGQGNATLETILKIAAALNATASELLKGLRLTCPTPINMTSSGRAASTSSQSVESKAIIKSMGQKIRRLRLERGWSQTKMAKVAGMYHNHIGEIERAEVDASCSSLDKIAKAFGTSVAELFEGIA